MKRLLRSSVFALALGAIGVIATAPSADAQQQYPQNSTVYRKRMDNFLKVVREQCQKACPASERERVMTTYRHMESRIMDVCADGWVTSAENDYVMAVQ